MYFHKIGKYRTLGTLEAGWRVSRGAEKGHATDHYAGWEDLPHQNIVEISQVSLNSF